MAALLLTGNPVSVLCHYERFCNTRPPQNNQRFRQNERLMCARHKEGCYEKNMFTPIFMVLKDYRTITSGRQGAQYSGRSGRELASKPAISSYMSCGGVAFLQKGLASIQSSHGIAIELHLHRSLFQF